MVTSDSSQGKPLISSLSSEGQTPSFSIALYHFCKEISFIVQIDLCSHRSTGIREKKHNGVTFSTEIVFSPWFAYGKSRAHRKIESITGRWCTAHPSNGISPYTFAPFRATCTRSMMPSIAAMEIRRVKFPVSMATAEMLESWWDVSCDLSVHSIRWCKHNLWFMFDVWVEWETLHDLSFALRTESDDWILWRFSIGKRRDV